MSDKPEGKQVHFTFKTTQEFLASIDTNLQKAMA